jgi:Family of unknown function (DUF6869)
MDHPNLDRLTDAYLRGHHEDHWEWEECQRIVKADLSAAWKLMLLMLKRAESDDALGRVAAGPLEDFIDLYGHKALDLIEEACKNNSRLQVALSQVGVLFHYDEFDRWYALLCKYGLRQAPGAIEGRVVAPKIMHLMKCLLNKTIGVADYEFSLNEWLDRPLDDKRAQRVLQAACYDIARLKDATRPEFRTPQMLRDSELRAQVEQSLRELESLGYRTSE